MFKKIPGNVGEDSRECLEDSGESSRTFGGMPEKVLGNVQEDFEELSKRFREIFEMNNREMIEKILENVTNDFEECSRQFQGSKYGFNISKYLTYLNMDLNMKFCLFLSPLAIKLLQNNGK